MDASFSFIVNESWIKLYEKYENVGPKMFLLLSFPVIFLSFREIATCSAEPSDKVTVDARFSFIVNES